jgi:hypothetical protein
MRRAFRLAALTAALLCAATSSSLVNDEQGSKRAIFQRSLREMTGPDAGKCLQLLCFKTLVFRYVSWCSVVENLTELCIECGIRLLTHTTEIADEDRR